MLAMIARYQLPESGDCSGPIVESDCSVPIIIGLDAAVGFRFLSMA